MWCIALTYELTHANMSYYMLSGAVWHQFLANHHARGTGNGICCYSLPAGNTLIGSPSKILPFPVHSATTIQMMHCRCIWCISTKFFNYVGIFHLFYRKMLENLDLRRLLVDFSTLYCTDWIWKLCHIILWDNQRTMFYVEIYLLNYKITLDSKVNKLSLTHKVPLPIGNVCRCVHIQHLEVQQPAVVCPRAKFQVTFLHVEGEPTHVDVAGALQDARGDILTVTWCIHQYVGVESGIKPLIRTGERITESTVFVHAISSFCYELKYGLLKSLHCLFGCFFFFFTSDTTSWQLLWNGYCQFVLLQRDDNLSENPVYECKT